MDKGNGRASNLHLAITAFKTQIRWPANSWSCLILDHCWWMRYASKEGEKNFEGRRERERESEMQPTIWLTDPTSNLLHLQSNNKWTNYQLPMAHSFDSCMFQMFIISTETHKNFIHVKRIKRIKQMSRLGREILH